MENQLNIRCHRSGTACHKNAEMEDLRCGPQQGPGAESQKKIRFCDSVRAILYKIPDHFR